MAVDKTSQRDLIPWYAQPAKHWFDILPLAKGRLNNFFDPFILFASK